MTGGSGMGSAGYEGVRVVIFVREVVMFYVT
jgi:hypothetical protein